MTLLELNSDNEVVMKPWIKLIPEFKALFKGKMNTDRAGFKFIKFVYFMVDFSSPLRNWNEETKLSESLRYCQLTEADITKEVKEAMKFYMNFQEENCRPLRTFRAARKGMEAMDEYLASVNFTETDKQGKLKFTPNQFIDNLTKTNKAYDELNKLERRVETELENNTGSRGNSTLGDKENSYANKNKAEAESWTEESREAVEAKGSMSDFSQLLQDIEQKIAK